MSSPEEVEVATIERQPLWNNRRWDHGPFDIIGDVHGCYEELVELLERLGYTLAQDGVVPPLGRKAVFLGDLVDRGPMAPKVVELVRAMVTTGHALCVPGNHDVKFVRAARGRKVQLTHGLARTMEQYALRESVHSGELAVAADFLDQLISLPHSGKVSGQSICAIIDAHLILKVGLGMRTQTNSIGKGNGKNSGNGSM